MKKYFLIVVLCCLSYSNNLYPCTNLLITKGASADGSAMLTYTADAGGFMEPLYYHPGGTHKEGEMVDIYEWDSGWLKYLGKIPQVKETYRVVGNMNEHQLTIGETTFGGRDELIDTTGIMDYGSLIYITLQRAKTAREAITIITDLVKEHGYHSGGESFSICDPNEVWILEMISKGKVEKGAVWVARRIPDGYISAHANKSRIDEIIEGKPDEFLYAPDVVSFAEKMGYYDRSKGIPFSFADAYDPATPSSLFACEGRVWSLFRRSAPSLNLQPDYFRGVKGAAKYPLYIKPDKLLTLSDVTDLMRDHFQGTEFDMTKGIAAGPYGNPYRWKPLYFKIEGDTTPYAWERPISTQQTAWSFIAQMRSNMPREIGGVFWYGVDDTYSTCYTPLYCCITEVPAPFKEANVTKFNFNTATWTFNLVGNLAYNMYSHIIKDIQVEQKRIENKYFTFQKPIESAALELYKTDKDLAIEYLTSYSKNQSDYTLKCWQELWERLVVKYNDRYINDVNKEGNEAGRSPGSAGYGNDFFKQVIKERPGYYEMKWKEPVKTKKK
ncbi:MAG: C69 family dipeptidase [Bacteroidetes bacterium]|nr:C69 family dipeptidase [Bacteroidota bacterium]